MGELRADAHGCAKNPYLHEIRGMMQQRQQAELRW